MADIKRKVADHREEKVREPRARKVKVNLSAMVDAIVDGKWTVPTLGYVVFERTLNKRTAIHEGTVFSVDADGVITLWDDTRGQFFAFSVTHAPGLVKAWPVTSGSSGSSPGG